MKIAGRKNDGAWFRTNQAILALSSAQRTSLLAKLNAIATLPAFVAALIAFQNKTGVTITGGGSWTASSLMTSYTVSGIPRQVWMGVMTFDTYTKQSSGKYTKDTEPSLRRFAIDLRGTVTQFIFAQREIDDVTDTGDVNQDNPGGNPDGTSPKVKA
jgi:hypothetical protein